MKGIDVSSYQGNINWEKVKAAGVNFAILKIIRKDLTADKQFENNWRGCENTGMPIQGVYNYSYATTVDKAKTDALAVVSVLNGRNTMVWLDVEDKCQTNLGNRLIDIILAYKQIIESAGLAFGIYTGLYFYNAYIKMYSSRLTDVPFWIARYPSNNSIKITTVVSNNNKPNINQIVYGWQFSSQGSIDGISGTVDMNEWYVDVKIPKMPIKTVEEYTIEDFVDDSAKIWGVSAKADMILKTVTISTTKNSTHPIVTPLERLMKSLGYYTGKALPLCMPGDMHM
jgi:GH25 family lysozyme M1 (1,4-beta-N-acetylmuramidase)